MALIFAVLLMSGFQLHAAETSGLGKQLSVKQSIDGAVRYFTSEQKRRLTDTSKAMAQVVPYLYLGPMGIDSREGLRVRIRQIEDASSHAAGLGYLHRDFSIAMVRMLEDQGMKTEAANERVGKLIATLRPEPLEATYEGWYLVLTALNRVYNYLDIHWGEWKPSGKGVEFSSEKLNIPYQTLMDRLGETVDQMDAIQNSLSESEQQPAKEESRISTKQEAVQAIDAAMQLFEAQRLLRVQAASESMVAVAPFLKREPSGMTRQALFEAQEAIENAIRPAAALVDMRASLQGSLTRLLESQQLKNRFEAQQIRKKIQDTSSGIGIGYEQRLKLLQALNRVYEYLDMHAGEWKQKGAAIAFADKKLAAPYRALIRAAEQAAMKVDEIHTSRKGFGGPLYCTLHSKATDDGQMQAALIIRNCGDAQITINRPSVGTVTWILTSDQQIGAHPGRAPETVSLPARAWISYQDTMSDMVQVQAARFESGKPQGTVNCSSAFNRHLLATVGENS
jgi:hypothetical protein